MTDHFATIRAALGNAYMNGTAEAEEALQALAADLARERERTTKLGEALRQHGDHNWDCYANNGADPCICGLDEALAALTPSSSADAADTGE